MAAGRASPRDCHRRCAQDGVSGRLMPAVDEEVLWIEWCDYEGSFLDAGDAADCACGVGEAWGARRVRRHGGDGEAKAGFGVVDADVPLNDACALPLPFVRMTRWQRLAFHVGDVRLQARRRTRRCGANHLGSRGRDVVVGRAVGCRASRHGTDGGVTAAATASAPRTNDTPVAVVVAAGRGSWPLAVPGEVAVAVASQAFQRPAACGNLVRRGQTVEAFVPHHLRNLPPALSGGGFLGGGASGDARGSTSRQPSASGGEMRRRPRLAAGQSLPPTWPWPSTSSEMRAPRRSLAETRGCCGSAATRSLLRRLPCLRRCARPVPSSRFASASCSSMASGRGWA